MARNSVMGYKHFIYEYPDSIHADETKMRIDRLDFDAADRRGELSDYEQYLKHHPAGQYQALATQRMQAITLKRIQSAFTSVKDKGTVGGYQEFLKRYPDTTYTQEAKEAITLIQKKEEDSLFKKAMDQKNYSGFRTYCRRCPEGRYLREAKRMLKHFS